MGQLSRSLEVAKQCLVLIVRSQYPAFKPPVMLAKTQLTSTRPRSKLLNLFACIDFKSDDHC
jgi:hypothetical protein